MLLKVHERAVIRWCEHRQCFCVHIGITIPFYGTINECELWCNQRHIGIRNQLDVDRIKYQNMPVWEGLA